MQATTETTANTRIIDLAELRGADDFPAYAAIYCRPEDNPQLLSISAMRWSENIVLCRLEDCKTFWQRQKKKLRCKLGELFEPLLAHHYGEDYLAVFGDHPWQCLLYLHYQLNHHGQGLYFLDSPINRNIYKNLGWDTWFDCQSRLYQHWQEIGVKGFRADSMRARLGQFKRFIERIGIANPDELKPAEANSIKRRFGKWLGLVWRWSFSGSSALDGFPWIALQPPAIPIRQRDLEYPVNQWAYIEVLLREDLLALGQQCARDDSEHVNRMRWQITLFNYDKVDVELSFRHPYSLHRDAPEFATALYQARYVYDAVMRDLQSRDKDLDLPEQMPFIGWTIEISERITLSPMLWDLFAFESDEVDFQRVYALQNKLPYAFECYQLYRSFFPEQSFERVRPDTVQSPEPDSAQWEKSAFNKPLFCYREALPIETPTRVEKVFLERNSNRWWLGEDALQSIRDYYMIKHPVNGASWVYRTAGGAWFKQGEFF